MSERSSAWLEPGYQLVCWIVLIVALLLAVNFDWTVHVMEVSRFQGPATGDFLIFWNNTIQALGLHVQTQAVPPQLYPPPFLLFTAPFAFLPLGAGYYSWIGTGTILLVLAGASLGLRRETLLLGLASPPFLFCLITGQSGLLVGALLLIAFGFAGRNSLLAGLAAGALIIKPQFALLLPVCFLARHDYKAFFIAALTAIGLCLISLACFGLHPWQEYWAAHGTNMHDMLTPRWLTKFQIMMVTPFIMARSLHIGLGVAGIIQGLVTLGAICAIWWLWRREARSPWPRLAASICLAALATPYGYVHDLPALGFAVAAYASFQPRRGLPALALLYGFTSVYAVISICFMSTGALFLALLLWMCWPRQVTHDAASGPPQQKQPLLAKQIGQPG